jgi:hypothetical protein
MGSIILLVVLLALWAARFACLGRAFRRLCSNSAGGQAVDGRLWTAHHGVARVNLPHIALIRKNVTGRHEEAPRGTNAHGLVMRRSRVRIPKAAL